VYLNDYFEIACLNKENAMHTANILCSEHTTMLLQ